MFNSDLLMENLYGNANKEIVNEIEMPSALLPNNIKNKATEKQASLYTPKEGYIKGNLFSNLYTPYKNYKPFHLEGKTEKEKLFLELSEMKFAAHELNLYLDVHPEDTSMIALFNDYRKRANKLAEEYEEKYGPLTTTSNALETAPWMWTAQVWPWEGSGL